MSPPEQAESFGRSAYPGSPLGMRRADDQGYDLLDAMAGRSCPLGFGNPAVVEAVQAASKRYLGDSSAFPMIALTPQQRHANSLAEPFRDLAGDSSSAPTDVVTLCGSADHALETAIALARTDVSSDAYRTIALVGSDHGRTAMCRTASGIPQLHERLGPMMAGFFHVPDGDLKALAAAIDDQTCCVLVSPIAIRNGFRPCDPTFLSGARELCDQHGCWLVIDETQIPFGSSGKAFAYTSIADVRVDAVALSAGLFAGLPGGLVLASNQLDSHAIITAAEFPLAESVVSATLSEMASQGLPDSAIESMQQFAVDLAEGVRNFEPVRDVQVLGTNIGIETDIPAIDLVHTAARRGLRIEATGETAVCMQPPSVMRQDDREELLRRLCESIDSIVRETAELTL